MMNLNKTITHINNSLFAAKMENIIQYMYEDELEKAVSVIFHKMREEILNNLEEYYGDVMFNAHMDLILAPIHEHHKQYYDTIMKYKLREYRKGRTQAKRLVSRAKKYAKQYSKTYYGAVKADTAKIPLSSMIKKDELFATSDFSAEHMRDKTFVASQNTLARVDKDINGIITQGYKDGWGINNVTNKITTRFDQLESWEAQRIARTEIHGSHMQGVMQTYQDMGVEYTQWASAHDNRTRDTHIEIDGEIIPFGGVFSNGLAHPGDTNGPIKEWINCRCGCIPWFCPPGFMVPIGMTNFRESDLVPTLDKWSNEQLITNIRQDSTLVRGFGLDDLPLDTKLMNREFAVAPSEMADDFGISQKGMDTIHQFQKKAHLSKNEMGFAFSENNGRIYTGLAKGDVDSVAIRTPGKCSTLHNHTSKGFNIPSGDDFYAYLKTGNERLGINCSNDEIWVIQHTNKKGLSNKYVNSVADKVDDLATKYSQKFKQEYRAELKRINKINDSELRKIELDELKIKVNTELLEKYNRELGDELLDYASKIEGLTVKRYKNVPIDKKEIPNLPKLKIEKNKGTLKRGNLINKNVEGHDNYALTESEIKQKLSQMSEREKFKELSQTLDKGQRKVYNQLISRLKSTNSSSKEYKEIQAKIFEYDKLLFKPRNPVPEIDVTKFKMDEQVGEVHTIKNTILEKKQINIQNKINFTDRELRDLHTYGGEDHKYINGCIKDNKTWEKWLSNKVKEGYSEEELINGVEEIINNMDSAMIKSPGLTQDTVIFSGTEFDGTLRPGDFSSFVEFRSCSYQYDSAESFKIDYPDRYMVKIYAPEGQKGISMNAKMSDGTRLGVSHEHEFLLPQGQEFQVIEVDHFNKRASILLI